LSELGIVLPLKVTTVRREAGACLEDLPGWANAVIGELLSELHRLDERIAQHDRHITAIAREDVRARQLMRLSGVGPTTAPAILATIGDGHEFRCGQQFAAWLGLNGLSRCAIALEERRGYWKAVVAIAAKNARMAWAMLAKGEQFLLPA
jgi:transposase